MRFTHLCTLLSILVASGGSYCSPVKRETPVWDLGTLQNPVDGSTVDAGNIFPFQFQISNWCEEGFTPFDVYLLDSKPDTSSLNATYGFAEYLHYFGHYNVANFAGLPPQFAYPPPPTFTLPALGSQYDGEEIFVAVVQSENGCPPDGHFEYGIASSGIYYSQQ